MKYTMIPECVIITIYFNSNGNLNQALKTYKQYYIQISK